VASQDVPGLTTQLQYFRQEMKPRQPLRRRSDLNKLRNISQENTMENVAAACRDDFCS
jgi:hypothetical protein